MPSSERDKERFSELLKEAMKRTQLSERDIGAITGRGRAQVNMWKHGGNLPQYPALRLLTDTLREEYPGLGSLPDELLTVAGFGEFIERSDETAGTPARGFCVDLDDENERLLWKLEAPRRVRESMVALWRLIRAPGAVDDLDRRLDEARQDERRRA